ncbi:MAG: hypothetical protein INR68_07045 [Methylobacterium mesophilicum]|nr:hypothetical protein [Methylobacterium mesophilicum]
MRLLPKQSQAARREPARKEAAGGLHSLDVARPYGARKPRFAEKGVRLPEDAGQQAAQAEAAAAVPSVASTMIGTSGRQNAAKPVTARLLAVAMAALPVLLSAAVLALTVVAAAAEAFVTHGTLFLNGAGEREPAGFIRRKSAASEMKAARVRHDNSSDAGSGAMQRSPRSVRRPNKPRRSVSHSGTRQGNGSADHASHSTGPCPNRSRARW